MKIDKSKLFNMMIKKLKKALFGGLVALASALPSTAQEPGLRPDMPCPPLTIESLQDQKPVCQLLSDALKEKPCPNLDVYVSTTFASNYIGNGGFVIGEGPVQQGLVTVTKKGNLCEEDSLTFKGWANYDYGNQECVEVDTIAEYTIPVRVLGRLLQYDNPDWKDKVTVGFGNWQYPGKVLGSNDSDDNVLIAGWTHESRIDIAGKCLHILPDRDVAHHGDLFEVTAFKELPLGDLVGCNWYVTPRLGVSYDREFFGQDGFNFFGDITTGVRKGRFGIEGFCGAQDVHNESSTLRKDAFYSGIRLEAKF
ncbi:MAG: hypothetical protein PHF67_02970 [Candidatus Nanoarchaeia archaeon]|nr:hypothetical protein [Candidatus Nanoarchaeia archaeon]